MSVVSHSILSAIEFYFSSSFAARVAWGMSFLPTSLDSIICCLEFCATARDVTVRSLNTL